MIKEIFEKMLNKIKFLIENKKQIVLLSLIIFILILLLILILSLSPKDKKSNSVENPFILSQELKNIDGGGVNVGLVVGIGAGITFLIGLIDGLFRPLKCN